MEINSQICIYLHEIMNGTSMKTGGERVRRRPVCSLENPRWSDSEGLAYPPQLECPPMLGTEQTGVKESSEPSPAVFLGRPCDTVFVYRLLGRAYPG